MTVCAISCSAIHLLRFVPCYDPGMLRLRWVPAAFMAVCLLSFLPLFILSDATMRLHIANLLGHSASRFLGAQGTTGLGFLTPFTVGGLSALATAVLLFALRGCSAVRQHLGQNVLVVLAGTITGNVLWFCPVFAWSLVKTVEADHQAQVELNKNNKSTTATLEAELERKRQNLQPTDPAFHNMVDTIQVFMRYRQDIGQPSANECRILITGPQQGTSPFEGNSQIEGLLMTFAVVGANCLNGNLLNIGVKPENAEQESLKGMVPGKLIVHAPPGAKGVDQLVDRLGNLIQTQRSYKMPATPVKIPENTIWLQISPGTKWNSEIR
jgi:hypothetical protein